MKKMLVFLSLTLFAFGELGYTDTIKRLQFWMNKSVLIMQDETMQDEASTKKCKDDARKANCYDARYKNGKISRLVLYEDGEVAEFNEVLYDNFATPTGFAECYKTNGELECSIYEAKGDEDKLKKKATYKHEKSKQFLAQQMDDSKGFTSRFSWSFSGEKSLEYYQANLSEARKKKEECEAEIGRKFGAMSEDEVYKFLDEMSSMKFPLDREPILEKEAVFKKLGISLSATECQNAEDALENEN